MQPGDIPQIIGLEADAPSAWSRQHFEDELRQPTGFQFIARSVASPRIVAYLCGRVVADEAEILKLSVASNMRRRGLGLKMLDFSLDYCREKGAGRCFLELRSSNTAARKLYEKKGFSSIGTRKTYYSEPVEDALIMQLALKPEKTEEKRRVYEEHQGP